MGSMTFAYFDYTIIMYEQVMDNRHNQAAHCPSPENTCSTFCGTFERKAGQSEVRGQT